jgi:hypothetical protein
MRPRPHILRQIAGLAAAEAAFLRARVVAAVARGSDVRVRIGGVRCDLGVTPRSFAGVGVFRPTSHRSCVLERPATLAERRAYFGLFPAVRLVVCATGDSALGVLANRSDSRFTVEGPVPIELAGEVDLFDTVVARFDGGRFWHDAVDDAADPGAARSLREAMVRSRPVEAIDRPGLTAAQRQAYDLQLSARQAAVRAEAERAWQVRRQTVEGRIADALEHGGARLRDFVRRGQNVRVRFELDGREHVSVVHADRLEVHSAGICLNGEDAKFDLASLIGVLREGSHMW